MHTAKPRMVVPYGLKTLLEGVSRAVLKASPSNITEFAAEYFKELINFREEHPNLDIKELVREFHVTRAEPAPEEAEAAPAEAEAAPEEGEPAPEEAENRTSATSLRAGSVTQSQTAIQEEIAISGSLAEQPPADLVEQASSDPLQEGEPPPPLPPPPPDKDLLPEGCPSEIELTSDIHITPAGDDDPSAGGEPVPPPYVEQFPQQIVIPFVDTVACLLDPLTASLNSGQFTSILDPSADDAECDPDRMDTTEQLKPTDPGFIMSAMATSEPGQPPPYSNVWTLYCLTDLKQQGRKSPPPPPPLPPVGTGATVPQATLFISSGKDQPQYLQPQMLQQGQPPQVSSPTYVMMEDGKKGNAPPFILVGSSVQNKQDWKPIPGHAVLTQPDAAGTVRRFATIPVPIARAADPKMANPNFNPAQDSGRPPTPVFLSVAIPLEDVMNGKNGSGAGDKAAFAGSYGIAGEITFTTASVRRTE
ncbi:Calcium-binding tyrosine phosphorylation-regulated protein [Ophiophagus hannah]|uniref:Calcium-binding tyrosine phosphorylation-regulated protein n=1 Tax=Ophiophagus hannah TaxID=8665 RepID=V8PHW2_OPHHA|nr:Calcium-binding tyrosine phosphorylation-regulated protein [Ophiophagus hannah]